jgi:hypothetical protein
MQRAAYISLNTGVGGNHKKTVKLIKAFYQEEKLCNY